MLKVAVEAGEKAGGALMAWWGGRGAARVLAHDADAVLLERAAGGRLSAMARGGLDEQATGIICNVIAELHAPRQAARPTLVPLAVWFRELEVAASRGGIFAIAWATARDLLAAPLDDGALHGDIHHDNILDFGPRGWLAIDPKALHGERSYDYANLFRNPEGSLPLRPERFERHVALVAERAELDPIRLLQWVLAVMGLSATWSVIDREFHETTLAVASKAAAALGKSVE